MAQQGTRSFYQITNELKTKLLADPNVNTVTFGDISDIDLNKQTIYPLAHIMINGVSFPDKLMNFNVSVITMDVVDVSKDEIVDIFTGNDNSQDVINTQLEVQNRLLMDLKRGDLYDSNYQLSGEPNCEMFTDRFENEVAGWVSTFNVQIINDIDIDGI